jgi:hypothetical protein
MNDGQVARPVAVEWISGAPCVVIRAPWAAEEIRRVVARWDAGVRYRGQDSLASAAPFLSAAAAMLALHRLNAAVPAAEPNRVSTMPSAGQWVSTRDAARLLGIGERAVRKRVAVGTLTGQKIGGVLWLNSEEMTSECNRTAS